MNERQFDFQPNPELVSLGWERRFLADRVRAEESIELYKSMGYEVLAEPVRPEELRDECLDCKVVVYFSYVTIYTRKKKD